MAKVTFEKLNKETDNDFYESTKQEAISKITLLRCSNDKDAFVHISIGAGGGRWSFKIIHACCPEFRELVRREVYPLAE
jgi:hypothetical protein